MAQCEWCRREKSGFGFGWKQVQGYWLCPEHQRPEQVEQIVTTRTTCIYCGGERPEHAEALGWKNDVTCWYCPGCNRLEQGDAAGVTQSAKVETAAARALIYACAEIDERFGRLPSDAAAEESKPYRERIETIGRALSEVGGEGLMRRVLALVRADADPGHLVTVMAGGTPFDPARKATVASHASYVEREWSGIGGWQG